MNRAKAQVSKGLVRNVRTSPFLFLRAFLMALLPPSSKLLAQRLMVVVQACLDG